uniref:BPL/LPL catalytic domain-containing protein n=1 Tax=Trichobilharzia regenti TaxID=157069 RepID=A0AA85KLV8_TRIRE|nr:unnamed protein product [Trichobilharzia regenti]
MGVILKSCVFQFVKYHHQYHMTAGLHQLNTSSRIFLLESNNIYRNLAFETCLYQAGEKQLHSLNDDNNNNHKLPAHFTNILLWRSNPCIVIGRFQNAWKEINSTVLRSKALQLARRYSGGGAVYHDLGNLNISFMQPKRYLDRRKCMEFLQSVLQPLISSTNCIVHVGDRYDLWISEKQTDENALENRLKISGSSSKLGADMAYHHCTLLFDANLNNLSEVLKPTFVNMQTKATDSIRSPVRNLNLSIELLQEAIIENSLKWISKNDGNISYPTVIKVPEGKEPQFIPSLGENFEKELNTLQSWSWIYGGSPAFQLALDDYEPDLHSITNQYGSIVLQCRRGSIVDCISFTGDDDSQQQPSHPLKEFLSELTACLQGAECRPNSWDFALDQFLSRKLIQLNSENIPNEALSIIRALKRISSQF